jgi:hypothetical protein
MEDFPPPPFEFPVGRRRFGHPYVQKAATLLGVSLLLLENDLSLLLLGNRVLHLTGAWNFLE